MQFKTIPSLPIIIRTTLLILCLFSRVHGSQERSAHIILTVLDDSEPSLYHGTVDENGRLKERLGVIAKDLLIALLEEQCIIIVNSSVVNYLMRYLHEVSNNPLGLIPVKKINPNNWIKKRVSDYLYILLPKDYIALKEPSRYKELKKINFNTLDEQELALGIKFKSLKDISDSDFMKPIYHPDLTLYSLKERIEKVEFTGSTITFTHELSWISHHVIGHLNDIFISKKKYKNFSNCMPHSIIIATGHGSHYYAITRQIQRLEKYGQEARFELQRLQKLRSLGKAAHYGGAIAGFDSKDFGMFVAFLAEHLSVQLLFFNTCYGAQANIQEALGELSIPFPIISGSLSSGMSYSRIERYESWTTNDYSDDQHDVKVWLTKPVFKNFCEVLTTNPVQSDDVFYQALEHLYPFVQKVDTSYNNIPCIKRPGEPWRVLEKPNIITLDKTLLQEQNGYSLDVSDSLDLCLLLRNKTMMFSALSRTFSHPNIILLRTSAIPYELILSGKRSIDLPAFISVKPGDALHHFVKIDAHTFLLSEFFGAFFKIPDLRENKTFVIDELIVKNNIKSTLQFAEEIVHLKNVVIAHEVDYTTGEILLKKSLYFEYNNTGWYIVMNGENAPVLHYIKKTATPEKIKQLLYQLKFENSASDVLSEDEDATNTFSDLEQPISDAGFVQALAWVVSFFY